MMWSLCIALIFILSVHAKPINHNALKPEIECLRDYMDIISDIMKEVHQITPPTNVAVGEYVVCYLKKRNILENDGTVINAGNIYKYWSEVYYTTISTQEEEKQLRGAAAKCSALTDPNVPILALKIKNCLLEGARDLPFVG